MKAILLLPLLVLANGLPKAQEPTRTFCVATYNLNWGNRHGEQILDAITTSNADVVFLQESTPQSEHFLRSRLKESYPHFHATGHKGRYGAERFAFASKVPLANLTFHPPADGLFGFYTAVCDVGGVQVQLVNVHLSPFIIRRGAGVADAMSALKATEERHLREIKTICKKISFMHPTIIAGDFNSLSTFNAPSQLAALGLTDSFAAVHENADTQPTWHWPSRPLPLNLRIDYIFHTRHFRTIQSKILQRLGSDHSLVVSELHLVEQSDAAAPPTSRGGNGKRTSPAR